MQDQKRQTSKKTAAYQTELPLAPLLKLLPPWYEKNQRVLPWRGTGDPYDVWISEIMLQQTRVQAVIGYFRRFKEALPDVAKLAACPDDVLMKLWEGLGYYSRARNLKKAAQIIVSEYGGHLPDSKEALLKLPGIGSYTAGAIASIAFSKPVPAVDGNVLRVCSRITGNERDIADPATKRALEEALTEEMQRQPSPGLFNQALMDLGATVCVPNGPPLCDGCPMREHCYARKYGQTDRLPVKSPKKKRRIEARTVLLIRHEDSWMIRRREKTGLLAGLWEFPSFAGELEEEEALARVRLLGRTEEELVALRIEKLPPAKHIFTHIEWRMTAWSIRIADIREAAVTRDEDARFVKTDEIFARYSIPSAFAPYLKWIGEQQGDDRQRLAP